MAQAKPKNETPAVELLEEALHLLRQAPASLAYYAVGTVPFVLGLLFFWADMSRSAYAASRCAAASLALALGFLWMKTWQAVFAGALRRRLGAAGARGGARGLAALAAAQTIVQPWGLFLFLPALLITLPFPWFYAFFQNVTAIGLDGPGGVRGTVRRAWAQAALWPVQNMTILLCLSFFALLVFLNVVMLLLTIPFLIKTFLGVELTLVKSPWAIFNSTFFASACALTYLCVDPLVKAAYVLRCFYGESLKTGEALWAELARLKRVGGAAVMLALALGLGWLGVSNDWAAQHVNVIENAASLIPNDMEKFDPFRVGRIGEGVYPGFREYTLPGAINIRPLRGPKAGQGQRIALGPNSFIQDQRRTTSFTHHVTSFTPKGLDNKTQGQPTPVATLFTPKGLDNKAQGQRSATLGHQTANTPNPERVPQNFAHAQAEASPQPTVSPAQLDRSIQQTLRGPRYAWRMPRQLKARVAEENQSVLELFIDSTFNRLKRWVKATGRWLEKILDKLFKPSSSNKPQRVATGPFFGDGFLALANLFLYVPLAIVLVTLGIFAWRLWLRRKSLLPPEEADPSLLTAQPDLTDEKTAADQLPTDGWLLLAQQMIDRGELRLAMRALYLASLAALAQAGLVRIRRSKSNLDYARELQRRAHAWPGLLDLFRASVAVFDRSWYGRHEVTPAGIEDFKTNYERIRSLVG